MVVVTARGPMRGSAVRPAAAVPPLEMLPAGRTCAVASCRNLLSRYNPGPECRAHQRAAEDDRHKRLTGPVDTHEQRMKRVLAHLGTGHFSSPQLAGLMRCDLFDVQQAVAALVIAMKVEQAQNNGTQGGKWRGWRLKA